MIYEENNTMDFEKKECMYTFICTYTHTLGCGFAMLTTTVNYFKNFVEFRIFAERAVKM